ncbi:MAG: heat-inducible transcription repressor HrcA [Clostridia bacterium]|nr:heat-inducible transcription repressor HrcA [Clostridia bacterium]
MAELSERKNQILASVVELYIKTGEPVGSKGLLAATGMNCSSATVRNEMNELDQLGYLIQPHTSAGRIPSEKGYRYYVDNLMMVRDIDEYTKRMIDAGISSSIGDPEKLVNSARELLADITKCACVSTAPVGETNLVRKIELVPVGRHTAMMVLLTSNGILKSRMCRVDGELNADILEKFYNLVKTFFIGKPSVDISLASVQTVAASVEEDYFIMLPLLAAVSDLAGSTGDSRLVIGGSSNLLALKDYGDSIASLLEFLSRKEPLNDVIHSYKGQLNVSIGSENRYKQLEDSSVVISKYSVNGDDSGTIGVIGPTRMDYENIIPSVRYLTDLVGRLITSALEE